MNKNIEWYFNEIELRLLQTPIIIDYSIVSKDILYIEGIIRIKIILKNEDSIEFFEYVTEKSGKLFPKKYSFHWQDKFGNLKKRWDNAPHYQSLSNFPNHIHYPDNRIMPDSSIPNILKIISEIEDEIGKTS